MRGRVPLLMVAVAAGSVIPGGVGCGQNAASESQRHPAEVALPAPQTEGEVSVEEALARRRSVRRFGSRDLTPEQISQLAWAAQGITEPTRGLRTAPSAGATYPLELYLVKGDGVYHYVPQGHKLRQLSGEDKRADLAAAALGQAWVRQAAVNFVIAAVYQRTSTRYGERAERYVHMEAGHVAQNLHLEAVALGLGSVPIGAFRDQSVSKVLELPSEQAPIYIIPVGHPAG